MAASHERAADVVGDISTSSDQFIYPARAGWAERTTYQYEPLDDATSCVRLLTLLPGEPFTRLCVVLQNVAFNAQHQPSYEALSYAWGSAEDPALVTVGELESDTIAITQNLAVTLPYLRYSDRCRTLWIEAVCTHSDRS